MTTTAPDRRKCFICGAESMFLELSSVTTLGSCDLDTRPPRMKRYTMRHWIQTCPDCGYVARKVSDRTSIDRSFLESEAYRSCDGIMFSSELARRFYRQHMILLADKRKGDAFYALLRASWDCDDEEDTQSAVLVREKAIRLADDLLSGEAGGDEDISLIRADLLRRSSHFEELLEEYKDAYYSEELKNQVIECEKVLAGRKRAECLTIHDAIELCADGGIRLDEYKPDVPEPERRDDRPVRRTFQEEFEHLYKLIDKRIKELERESKEKADD